MSRILKYDWDDDTLNWSEHEIQCAIAQELRKAQMNVGGFLFAADQNGASVSRSRSAALQAKAAGMQAGETDLRIYLPAGSLVHVELKGRRTVISDAQKARHKALKALGHHVYVVRAATPAEGVAQVNEILQRHGIAWPPVFS